MANLPDKLINEILLWLPVKSLLRFRCVCKAFCAMIECQSFINSHFKRSSENRIHYRLIDLGIHKAANYGLEIQALAFSDDFQREVVLEKSFPAKYPLFFSSCNGLVLLFIDELSIWNPSTRQHRILPAFPVRYIRRHNFALGYDSTTDDYKAVAIVSRKGWDTPQVWIFELRSSCWRRIQDFPYKVSYNTIEGGGCNGGNGDCFVDGAIHFLCGHKDVFGTHIIVKFDVAEETFSEVDCPVPLTRAFPTRLLVFGGCLSYGLSGLAKEPGISVYVRKKDGVAFTWTKLYYIADEQLSRVADERFSDGRVAYSKEGDKVFLSFNGGLYSYDLGEKSFQQIATTNITNLDLFSCIETLASVGITRTECAKGKKRKVLQK